MTTSTSKVADTADLTVVTDDGLVVHAKMASYLRGQTRSRFQEGFPAEFEFTILGVGFDLGTDGKLAEFVSDWSETTDLDFAVVEKNPKMLWDVYGDELQEKLEAAQRELWEGELY